MRTNKGPAVLEHEYDGIREYDNPTPGWWHLIFLLTVVFAGMYVTFWHFSPHSWTVEDSWREAQTEDYRKVFGAVGDLKPDEATILAMMANPKMMDVARSTFQGTCAVCHGKDGGGINGVNLTDDTYKNVKTLGDVFTTITKGANLGAMPGWERSLSSNERVILTAYVASLRGKNVPGRAPEGEKIAPWPVAAAEQPAAK